MKETVLLDIKGMHCAACVVRIEKVVSKIDGVIDVTVSLATEKARVTFIQNRTAMSTIIKRINKIGFIAKIASKNHADSERDKRKDLSILKWNFIVSALLTIPLAWAMLAHMKWTSFIHVPVLFTDPLFQLAIAIPIQFVIGFPFYERAWKALRSKSANMDVLVVLSTSAAFFYSHYLTITALKMGHEIHSVDLFYETSAFIITFILLGKFIEAKTKLKTTEAIKKLYELQTKTATLYMNGQQVNAPVDQLVLGNIIIIKPGEKVPIDGQVISGNSMIDESLLTGESNPVEKSLGTYVYAGTVNQSGLLKIKVTKRDFETTLAQIIRIVEEAQSTKAPIQHIADKVTGIFVPIVIVISLITFVLWYVYIQPGYLYEALEKVITVLIIACPCALGLATPTSVVVGSGRAAQLGILFKEGAFLESLGECTTVILDKTGTITRGKPIVTNIYVEHFGETTFLEMIGAVEQQLEHPVANAIVNKAKTKVIRFPSVTNLRNIPGYGVEAVVRDKKVLIASTRYFIKANLYIPAKASILINTLEKEGKTVVIASIDSRFAGIIAVADEVKTSSRTAVARLKKLGLEVIMLTGDNRSTALAVAKKVRINNYRSEVTPQEKASIVKKLQHDRRKVIMVGDGINDAPALSVADVGIAIGTGSDVAIESGDVTILKGDLNRVVDALIISKKTMTNIKQNLVWAFLYNIIMIPIAMLGFLVPWFAGAAMASSSISVVLNSLRLKKVKI